jgi:HK97 family phage portal protein
MFKNITKAFKRSSALDANNSAQSYFYQLTAPIWSNRDYKKFADEAYTKNVIAHRAIAMIAQAAASVPFKLYGANKTAIEQHPILNLLNHPNPSTSGKEFMESLYSYRQISGNAYVLGVTGHNNTPHELYALRPDRISILPGENFVPNGYRYKVGTYTKDYLVNPISGRSQILHLKNFHPLSDWYGLSSIEAAAYSIDQHNQAGQWNQSLLQNGARPSGVIVVQGDKGRSRGLTEKQFHQLKSSIEDTFAGPKNAGRPLLLEGGLDWKEMSMSPKDMDFIESKHSSARDIALALGMPPQLLGIPGDNTYSNLQEARLALWEQTIIPMVDNVVNNLNNWLVPYFGKELRLDYDIESISAIAERKESMWAKIENCSFMTINEKRAQFNLPPIDDTNKLQN